MNSNYLSVSEEQEKQIFLNSFFVIAKNNIEEYLNFDDLLQFTSFSPFLNYWRNFSLNFKDESFVETLCRNEFNLIMIDKILSAIEKFLENSVCNIDVFFKKVGRNNSKFAEVISIFYDVFQNLCESKFCDFLNKERKESLNLHMNNYMKFSLINLKDLSIVVFEKVGYAYLDFKGNFCKIDLIIKLVFADRHVSETIFECDNLEGKNFFDLLTIYSQLIIRLTHKPNFYDYKNVDCRIRELVFSVDLSKLRTKSKGDQIETQPEKTLNFNQKIIQILNDSKTLVGRFSTILLPSTKKDDNPTSCILLEVKISKRRQNFDDFLWRQIIN